MSESGRRVAVVTDASFYAGPHLARKLAAKNHDLVLGDAPQELVEELVAMGAAVETVAGVRNIAKPESSDQLVAAALTRFGRIDSAIASSGRVVTGRFLESSIDDLHAVVKGCLEAPYYFLRAVVPVMVEQGNGQVLLMTSAAGARTTPGAPLYSAARAGATMLAKNVAAEVARTGVQVNVVGTNFMDFPEFLRGERCDRCRVPRHGRSTGPDATPRHARRVRRLLHAVRRRHERLYHRPVRRLRRRLGLTDPSALSEISAPTPEKSDNCWWSFQPHA